MLLSQGQIVSQGSHRSPAPGRPLSALLGTSLKVIKAEGYRQVVPGVGLEQALVSGRWGGVGRARRPTSQLGELGSRLGSHLGRVPKGAAALERFQFPALGLVEAHHLGIGKQAHPLHLHGAQLVEHVVHQLLPQAAALV